jgi:hypothetical protein
MNIRRGVLAVLVIAAILIGGGFAYHAHRQRRIQAYLDCYRQWNFHSNWQPLKQVCGDEP